MRADSRWASRAARSVAIAIVGAVVGVSWGATSVAADAGVTGATPAVRAARDAGRATATAPTAGAAGDTGSRATAGALPAGMDDSTPMPAGHPAVGDDGDGDGSDDGTATAPAGNDPHAGGAMPGMFQPWPDTEEDSDKLPVGSIEIEVRDESDKPVPNLDVTLGVINQSIAKGESRKHLAGETSGNGIVRFDHLQTGSQFAYRVSVPKDGATFAAMPFQLTQTKGRHVVLHVYPVTSDISKAIVVTQNLLYVELKDDRIQLQEAIEIYNLGKTTWVPDKLLIPLPEDFTALTSQQMMSDQGVDAVDKKGFRLHGTFPPGRHEIEFRYQLPYDGQSQLDFAIGVTPHLASARVMVAASQQMRVEVEGFPAAQPTTDAQGNHILVTEREMVRSDHPMEEMRIGLRNIPTRGPAHLVATGIAGCIVLFGLVIGVASQGRKTGPDPKAKKRERNRLLAELEGLEKAREAGDVGPKTYERARRELIDGIARTLA